MPGQSGYAIGWGTLALINAGLAQGKRRSGLLWFILSLAVGPLATFFIVILPPSNEPPRPMGRTELLILGFALLVLVLVFYLTVVGSAMSPIPHVGGG